MAVARRERNTAVSASDVRLPQAVLVGVYRTLKLRGLAPTKTIANALRAGPAISRLPPFPHAAIAHG